MLTDAEKLIISTIAYYDELSYPLTAFETWKLLTIMEGGKEARLKAGNIGLENIIKYLEKGELRNYVDEYWGFYFLKGRNNLVEKRIAKEKISSLKLKRLGKIAWFFRFIPFVRMVAVTGRLAMKNSGKISDWDLLVAFRKGKIWTGRTLFTIFVQLIGKRRYGNKIKNRICLNYFVADESLKIKNESRPFEVNLFSASEYSFIIPLFGFRKFRKFQIRNSWIKNFKPNYSLTEAKNLKVISDTHLSKAVRKCGEKILGFEIIENFLRKLETERIAKNPKTHLFGSIIEANDETLVFLPEPQGKEIYEKTKEKLIQIGVY